MMLEDALGGLLLIGAPWGPAMMISSLSYRHVMIGMSHLDDVSGPDLMERNLRFNHFQFPAMEEEHT
jgi:hypothetical protein